MLLLAASPTASLVDLEGVVLAAAVVTLLVARAAAAAVGGQDRLPRERVLDAVTVPLAFTALVVLASKFLELIQAP